MSNFIWTKHALQRLNDRKIPKSFADKTLESPDETTSNEDGTMKIKKRMETQTATAIIKLNEKNESIVLSFWLNPPNPGTDDFRYKEMRKEMKKASFAKKLWLTLRNQIGL
ncbi:MAG: hypothetical protein ACD_37C00327G0002 [uncultured bacterium]|nr:MAG: hypothetical protein ACD_37C00327G0002 [uncultured bacterium]